ncbi:hypothetical protein [Streptomyces flaveolus]|uniref:hypothetical protein n=1 Tax=Streptomyces flaveolus TaxID=67297 RepID=UPI003800EF51
MGDNPDRLNTEASLAALCGVSPPWSTHPADGTGSTTAATARRTRPCTASSSPACATTAHPGVLRTPQPVRQDPTRRHPMPQAICRPRDVQPGQTGFPHPPR